MRRTSSPSFLLWVAVVAAAATTNSVDAFLNSHKSSLLSPQPHGTRLRASVVNPQEVNGADNAVAPEVLEPNASTTTTSTTTTAEPVTVSAANDASLTPAVISKLRFRELHRALGDRHLAVTGTTGQLRDRLREAVQSNGEAEDCIVSAEDDCQDSPSEARMDRIMSFVDESDPSKDFIREIKDKASQGHWKAATRKLKKLSRWAAAPDNKIESVPESVYLDVLEACMDNRLQGARASEPARKILEQMVEQGYSIPEAAGNYCIKNCLGYNPDSTHQGFGGVDTALAMQAALDQAGTTIQADTYDRLCVSLAREGSVELALQILRDMVVDQAQTPPLATFAAVAQAAIAHPADKHEEKVLNVLAYAKAAGYELDSIASIEDGRNTLAAGVIAAERLDNVALGLRLLTAAGNAEGVAPDRGDIMVALSSSAAQRACQLIHKRAINKSVEGAQWKLAVTVLELMLQRSLKPSSWVWRNVVTCCAKEERSKKATALLLKWVELAEQGKADKPPLSVFNTCVNACEICNEQELTLVVLDAMQKTHEMEGNLITSNIALKRLAKRHDFLACEGIILGMLQSQVEPSVVSYTTAIAACASKENKQASVAMEWIKRMRSRNVMPNVLTYNTALAACLDNSLESTFLGSKLASEMMTDCERQLQLSDAELDAYTNVVPDSTTKFLARQLMEQLKQNWKAGAIDKRVATDTVRVPLKQLMDFQKSDVVARVQEKTQAASSAEADEDQATSTRRDEVELEYQTAKRSAEV